MDTISLTLYERPRKEVGLLTGGTHVHVRVRLHVQGGGWVDWRVDESIHTQEVW